ncbi:MAG: hypothetical protein ATN36_06635 [Epulopiscium sp. Nele67-Bin005]|nr:MAG: hypothetical protein ATN36_06635 [Epulopiscium sp. Nele67-Bin005]
MSLVLLASSDAFDINKINYNLQYLDTKTEVIEKELDNLDEIIKNISQNREDIQALQEAFDNLDLTSEINEIIANLQNDVTFLESEFSDITKTLDEFEVSQIKQDSLIDFLQGAVEDLETATLQYKQNLGTSTDFNSVIEEGFYVVSGYNFKNSPYDDIDVSYYLLQGLLTVRVVQTFIVQELILRTNSNYCTQRLTRVCYADAWNKWFAHATSSNILTARNATDERTIVKLRGNSAINFGVDLYAKEADEVLSYATYHNGEYKTEKEICTTDTVSSLVEKSIDAIAGNVDDVLEITKQELIDHITSELSKKLDITSNNYIRSFTDNTLSDEDLQNNNFPYPYVTMVPAAATKLGLPVNSYYHVCYYRHYHGNGYGFQIAYPLSHDGDVMYRRSGGTNWGSWKQLSGTTENTETEVTTPTTSEKTAFSLTANSTTYTINAQNCFVKDDIVYISASIRTSATTTLVNGTLSVVSLPAEYAPAFATPLAGFGSSNSTYTLSLSHGAVTAYVRTNGAIEVFVLDAGSTASGIKQFVINGSYPLK